MSNEERSNKLPQWPDPIRTAVFHGLAGDIVATIDPHTEADPMALLLTFLAGFGNMIGPKAHFMVEATENPCRIWPVLAGASAARKGSAWSNVARILKLADHDWYDRCQASGISTGEGLIWAVRDPVKATESLADGVVEEQIIDAGVTDKHLFLMEAEFSSLLKAAGRPGNTVSGTLRCAWDSGDLRTMTKKSHSRIAAARHADWGFSHEGQPSRWDSPCNRQQHQ